MLISSIAISTMISAQERVQCLQNTRRVSCMEQESLS